MTIRYVDITLTAGDTSTYKPTADAGSRHTGGSDEGYEHIADAEAAAAGGDTIYIREGAYGPYSATTQNIRLNILKYVTPAGIKEEHTITYTDGQHGWVINSTAANNSNIDLHIVGNGAANKRAFFVTTNVIGMTVNLEIDDWRLGSTIAIYESSATANNTYKKIVLKNCGQFESVGISNIDVFAAFDVATKAINAQNASGNTIGQCLIAGGGDTTSGVIDSATNATLTIKNLIMFGIGAVTNSNATYPFRTNTGATITVEEGVVHGNVYRPHDIMQNGAGTLTATNVIFNGRIEFDDPGFNDCYALWYAVDSNHLAATQPGDTRSIENYAAAFVASGKHLSYFPDDQTDQQNDTDYQATLLSLANTGHDMGVECQSSSDLTYLAPMKVKSTTGGETGTLTISSNGDVLNYVSDDTPSDNIVDLDISRTSTITSGVGSINNIRYTGAATSDVDPAPTVALANYLNTLASNSLNVEVYADGNSFDDSFSYCLADDVYSITDTFTDLLWDRDRLFGEEVTWSAEVTAGYSQKPVTSYFQGKYAYASDILPFLRSNSINISIAQQGPFTSIATMTDIFNISNAHAQKAWMMGAGTWSGKADWESLNSAQQDTRAEEFANVLKAVGYRYGFCFPLLMPDNAPQATYNLVDFIPPFIARCVVLGIKVMSFKEMMDDLDTTYDVSGESWTISYTENYSPVQAADSEGLGTGTKWWGTDPRPAGLNGEPFPDSDIDTGANQSTLSANHPENL